ncbi:glycerophosphoryl diester phosphodiesterase membrane domain-containing protein [Nonomuraea sp. NPDC047897]|uniref:glycerophosphoryl diester phosphodiesterase membrane domain-containing protein n=1 Tax=Nonomuraea sp. NPDC047897 TaxID=3364346 RepID=UPI0037106E4C
MSDGHGPTPETPPGWAVEQPPPYGAPQASPWTAPGLHPPAAPGAGPGHGPGHGTGHGAQGPPPPQQWQQPGYGYLPPPALRPGIIPLRPLGLGDILDGTIKLIRSNPKAVLGLSAVAALLAAVPVSIGNVFLLDATAAAMADPAADPGDLPGGFLAQFGGPLVSLAVGFVVVTMLTGVLTRILGRAVFGGNMTAAEAWRLTRGRVPALFAVVALQAAILLAPLVVVVLIVWALVASGGSMPPGAGVAGLLLFMVFYVCYVLFFRTRFAFAAPAVVLESRGPLDAMRRSWTLVGGGFWRVLGILLLTSLLVGFIGSILQLPFTIAGTLFGMLGGGGVGTLILAGVLTAVGGTLGAMITYPFEAGVAGLLYADRRMRSEAFDLVLQTAAIEQQRQGWVHSSADDLWHPSNSAGS